MTYKSIIFAVQLLVVPLAVGVALVPPASGDVFKTSEGKTGDPSRGGQTWADNCGRCHLVRDPQEFRDDLWRVSVTHMRVRAGLTGKQARDILAFLQKSNHSSPQGLGFAALAPPGLSAGLSAKDIYDETCVACHAPDGKGAVPGAPDFTSPSGVLSKSDPLLLQHIKEGFQSPGSPMAMPPRGGNTDLTDEDLKKSLGYIRGQFGS